MKRAIPEAGKIAKDARECVQECVSEFISFITSEASDRCHMEKRKTINGEDILFAMTTLGFDNYVEPLKLYLQKYREATKGDSPTGVTPPANTKSEPQNTIYEEQLFAIAPSGSTTSETPMIYSYSSTDPMQFQLSWCSNYGIDDDDDNDEDGDEESATIFDQIEDTTESSASSYEQQTPIEEWPRLVLRSTASNIIRARKRKRQN